MARHDKIVLRTLHDGELYSVVCPFCGKDNIIGSCQYDFDGSTVELSCKHCDQKYWLYGYFITTKAGGYRFKYRAAKTKKELV